MATKPDSTQSFFLQCKRCGTAMQLLYRILDTTSGKQVPAFKCECGERAVAYKAVSVA